jgi:hypothetical protein
MENFYVSQHVYNSIKCDKWQVKYIPVILFNQDHDCSLVSFLPRRPMRKIPCPWLNYQANLNILISKQMMAEGKEKEEDH